MAAWPLGSPMVDGYGLSPDNPVIRTSMEGGPAKQRRRYTQAPTKVTAQWIFTEAEMLIFENFHKTTLYDGAAWFDIDLYNGIGSSTYSARFIEMWNATMVGDSHWQVTGVLEVNSRPLS